MTEHLQGQFGKWNDEWAAAIKSGQERTANTGEQVTLHKKNGDIEQVTLVELLGQKGDPESDHTSYYSFTRGWEENSADIDDWAY